MTELARAAADGVEQARDADTNTPGDQSSDDTEGDDATVAAADED